MKLLIITFLSFLLDATTSSPLIPRQATNGPHPPTILWSCTGNTDPSLDIPNVCSNMCYGVYCRGYGSSLWFDPFATSLPPNILALRKANAGCYSGIAGTPDVNRDRCQDQGLACNVYPYITAVEFAVDGEKGGPISRCVDSGEDARQSAMLNLFYTSKGPWSNDQGLDSTGFPVHYQQIFANAGELRYCSGLPSDCIPDGSEFDRNGYIITYDPLPRQKMQRRYRLSGGGNVTVTQEMEIGREVFLPRVRNGKKFLELSERRGGDREGALEELQEHLYFDVEAIEEEILDISVYSG